MWCFFKLFNCDEFVVGVFGMGVFGMYIVKMLVGFGFLVCGWSCFVKYVDGVDCCVGSDVLLGFFVGMWVLVNVLLLMVDIENVIDVKLLV